MWVAGKQSHHHLTSQQDVQSVIEQEEMPSQGPWEIQFGCWEIFMERVVKTWHPAAQGSDGAPIPGGI